MSNTTPDAGIPLLTEIIPVAAENRTAEPSATASPFMPLSIQTAAGPDVRQVTARNDTILPSALDNEQWSRLERELRQRITQELCARVDAIVEDRIQESLSAILRVAVESIASDLRASLHQSMADAVSEAVAAEITSIKIKNK